MHTTSETTQREDESVVGAARPQTWLRWVAVSEGVFPLDHGLVVGRDPECQVRLNGEGVSRRHLEIYRQGPVFAVKDLGSTNGTFLNGKRIEHAVVIPGAVLRVGAHVGVFAESTEQPHEFQALTNDLFGGLELGQALTAVRRAGTSSISVVIIGATGTGKEGVARAIHQMSGRRGAFHPINCAALPPSLAEAELFGYRKGAFTGAERASLGHLRAADRGTLFLDEIVELPLNLQAKLLRVLEEQSVTPLGETEAIPIDVRFVAASQRPLEEPAAAQTFRDDLLARLAGLTVTLPTLHDRRSDIAPLFRHFIHRYSGGRPPEIDSKLLECLCLHDWPGNVRELEQLARRVLAIHGHEKLLKRAVLPEPLLARVSFGSNTPSNAPPPARREHDAQRLALALKNGGGSVVAAAREVGISRQRAYRLLGGKTVADFVAAQTTGILGKGSNA
jgi:transcriptional regulator with PAS, ATPase and Fis domain